jgi:DNA-binding XRE family transcriptional regulator
VILSFLILAVDFMSELTYRCQQGIGYTAGSEGYSRGEVMKSAKKKRLERKGWKVGSVAQFLHLSTKEPIYIEMKLALSKNLRERRKSRSLTQDQLADLLKSSQSRVAKMEAGDPSVSLDLLVRSLLALGESRRSLAKILSEPRL